jgi:hypothetical protein
MGFTTTVHGGFMLTSMTRLAMGQSIKMAAMLD